MKMDYTEYRKKLDGCYLGKAVGGTLGMPFEGKLETRTVTYYDPVPDSMVANDDLDLQLIDLELVRRFGLPVNRHHLSQLWYMIQEAGPDEYGPARWNTGLNRFAPLSGYYCNKFGAGMGAAIRSELWASLAPGDPALAVRLAREDACTDHYDDGVEACVFLTAVESAAYVESDMMTLVSTGFRFIDPDGRLAHGLRDAMRFWDETKDALKARELLLNGYYVQNWTDVTINLGLILISWLASGGDFSKGICTAAGLGYDADCTCATLGSIMGIIDPDCITEEWTRPIGDQLVITASIMGLHEPRSVYGFCDRVAETAHEVLRYYGSEMSLTDIPEQILSLRMHAPWTQDRHAADAWDSPNEAMAAVSPLVVRVCYPEQTSIVPGVPAQFRIVLHNPLQRPVAGSVSVNLPDGWTAEPASFDFSLAQGADSEAHVTVTAGNEYLRRQRANPMQLAFSTKDGMTWEVMTDCPLAYPWLRTNLDTGKTEKIEAHAVFQPVPEGHWLYRTAMKVNPFIPARVGAMSNRALKVTFNGEKLIETDGSFYVPAFHRGRTCRDTKTVRRWNTVEIEIADGKPGELFFGLAKPENCCEWLPGVEFSLTPFEE